MIDKIISHYKLIEPLGEGGMGVVYKAEDTRLKRLVALKFLTPDLTRDPEAKARFIQEARAASALDHNNIGVIYEIDQTPDGQIFIAMAFYDGQTLRQKIAAEKLDPATCLDFAVQIAQGLAQAHKHQIVHRDIKPANILVTKDGVLKLVDFGLAKLAGGIQITQVGTRMGTPAYMSPEQIRGLEVDHRTDIWAFGIVFYEMLTGQLPFHGDNHQVVFYAALNHDPTPMSQLNAGVPNELEQVVRRALQKEIASRYATMQAMLDDLRRIQKQMSREKKQSETQEVTKLLNGARRELEKGATQALPSQKISNKFRWISAATLALLGGALFGIFMLQPNAPEPSTLPAPNSPAAADSAKRATLQTEASAGQAEAERNKGIAEDNFKQEAETARRQMAFKKRTVLASARNTAAYREATTVEANGDNQFSRGDYRAARQFFDEAQKLYEQAARAAPPSTTVSPRAGILTVLSTPPGAQVYLDGLSTKQVTPYEGTNLQAGPHKIRLALAGYADTTVAAEVYANRTQSVQVNLRPRLLALSGKLNVNAVFFENNEEKPAAALVLIDDKAQTGLTPRRFSLAAGTYRLSGKFLGYRLVGGAQEVVMRSGETARVKFVFIKE